MFLDAINSGFCTWIRIFSTTAGSHFRIQCSSLESKYFQLQPAEGRFWTLKSLALLVQYGIHRRERKLDFLIARGLDSYVSCLYSAANTTAVHLPQSHRKKKCITELSPARWNGNLLAQRLVHCETRCLWECFSLSSITPDEFNLLASPELEVEESFNISIYYSWERIVAGLKSLQKQFENDNNLLLNRIQRRAIFGTIRILEALIWALWLDCSRAEDESWIPVRRDCHQVENKAAYHIQRVAKSDGFILLNPGEISIMHRVEN